jgi:hypothetical protein
MKKRAKAGVEPSKGRRRKRPEPERLHAPKALAHSNSPPAGEETEVARLRRERDEAFEQQTATSEVLQAISSPDSSPNDPCGKSLRQCRLDSRTMADASANSGAWGSADESSDTTRTAPGAGAPHGLPLKRKSGLRARGPPPARDTCAIVREPD